MQITVVGTGYVGLITAICFADFGHHVVGYDLNPVTVEKLSKGICHIYEPGAESYLERGLSSGRLRFTINCKDAIQGADLCFLCVGTPEDSNGEADLSQLFGAVTEISRLMENPLVFVDKSTVPVGTARRVKAAAEEVLKTRGLSLAISVVSNPEFLREGRAVGDFLNPDRIVVGADDDVAIEKMKRLYQAFERSNKPIVTTNLETAEMIKYASNAFLATKIGFINEIATLCEATGANVQEVARGMGLDGRIGSKFLHAGPGYGGSCFPKDTKALAHIGRQNGVLLSIVESVIASNEQQKRRAAKRIIETLAPGSTLALLGLAFKPETDDIRESPALAIVNYLLAESDIRIRVYDPQAMNNARAMLASTPGQERVQWCNGTEECLDGCKAAALVTEWVEFRNLDLFKRPELEILYDFRNIFRPEEILPLGIQYFGTGVKA